MSELTVTCRQCGGVEMVRLDRKEYKCQHCGAITVISDTDAKRLEQLLEQVLARQAVPPLALMSKRIAFGAGFAAFAVLLIVVILVSPRRRSPGGGGKSADQFLIESSVPNNQVVLSALEWHADSSHGGSYTGVAYNHSGYAITPPRYGLNLFRGGMKEGSALTSMSLVTTLEPGEYQPVSFRYESGLAAERYEVEQPAHVGRSLSEVVAVPLLNSMLVHTAGLGLYALVGSVRNDLKRPISGIGELMIYGANGAIVGSGVGSFSKLKPGEQTLVTMNAFSYTSEVQVAAYEYLLDVSYESQAQSISLEEWRRAGTTTVPSRMVRVNAPKMRLLAPGQ